MRLYLDKGYTCVPVLVSEAGQEGASVQQRNELLNPVPKHRGLILGGQGALDAAMAPFKELDRLRAENQTLRNIAVTADEERDALRSRVEGLEKALRTIIEWGPFPETGHHHPDGTPMSYGWCYGSNGERDYMRAIARAALAQAGEG